MTLRRAACVAAFAACAAATVAIVRSAPDLSLAGASVGTLAGETVAAAIPVVAILLVWRPVFGGLLVAAMCAWLASEWNSPGAGALFTPGLVVFAVWPVLVAAAALRGLDERPLGRGGWTVVAVGTIATAAVLGVASAAVFDPRAQGCAGCPANHLLIANAPAAAHDLGRVGLALSLAWAAGFCVVAAIRLARASAPRRRLAAPVLVPAAVAVALFGVDAAHGLDRGFLSSDPTGRALRVAEAVALALIAAGIALERLRLRRTRTRVAQLVVDIGAAPAPGELRARLAATLGDPALMLLHPVDGGWMDETGRAVDLPSPGDRAVTLVRAGGEDVLAVVHRRGLLDDPQLVDELATTARLAIEHERLQAAHRARLEELRASRVRIVAAADRERRALERDLHDGAQQRLVTLGLSIRLARRRRPADDAGLAAAEEHMRAAVVDLREVAHGLFPTVLADEGLGTAIDVLSEQAPRLVTRRLPDGRFPDAVESAAYFATREALRLTAREVTVDAVAEDGCLRLTIAADGTLGAAITQIQDRVGAADGTVTSRPGELLLEMPCGS
jgi:signal transduction histidine kinase